MEQRRNYAARWDAKSISKGMEECAKGMEQNENWELMLQ